MSTKKHKITSEAKCLLVATEKKPTIAICKRQRTNIFILSLVFCLAIVQFVKWLFGRSNFEWRWSLRTPFLQSQLLRHAKIRSRLLSQGCTAWCHKIIVVPWKMGHLGQRMASNYYAKSHFSTCHLATKLITNFMVPEQQVYRFTICFAV